MRTTSKCWTVSARAGVLGAIAAALAGLAPFSLAASEGGNAGWIDPRIGTENDGNTIIGPSMPFGMAKPGPDTGDNNRNSGWGRGEKINGFSQTHVSGTGGGCKYGNILVQPTVGPLEIQDAGSPGEEETVRLGYYGVRLARYGILAEVTATERAALYRFTYPESGQSRILIDTGHHLSSASHAGEQQDLVASSVQVLSPTEVAGFSSIKGGWNKPSKPYTVYFYAATDTPAKSFGTWKGGEAKPGSARADGDSEPTGAWLEFPTKNGQAVRMKIGISFVGVEQAKANAGQVRDFDFEGTNRALVAAWNDALNPVQVNGGSDQQKRLLFTSLYHVMLMPADRTGENPLWKSGEPYYDDFYAIWDTFRTSAPLLTLIAPKRQADMARALIDIQRHEGFLPDARSGNFNGRTQGGSDADILLADAFAKKVPGIDWNAAYAAVVKDAEVAPEDQMKEGRGGLEDWHRIGYCSIEGVDRPGSKTMEYAYNDFCIAQMARGLGKAKDADKYLQRSGQWKNLWDADFVDSGFSGFIRPRHRDGTWKQDFSPFQGCSWGGDTFYEGNSWVYSFFVPHDVRGLIEKCGGRERFVERLSAFFDGRYDVANEPFFLTPYLYVWAGRHDKTAEILHKILTGKFKAEPGGLPGNDDSGAMGSWYAFGAMGFFPNAGQDVYVLGTPLFSSASLSLPNGKTFVIRADNLSDKNIYVARATLNGKPYDKAWLRHRDLMAGGTLVLEMSDRPGAWPSGDPPP